MVILNFNGVLLAVQLFDPTDETPVPSPDSGQPGSQTVTEEQGISTAFAYFEDCWLAHHSESKK